MSAIGPTLVITSSVLIYNYPGRYDDVAFKVYSGLLLAGIGTTLIGLPKLIAGSSRVKRIDNLKRNSHTGFIINVKPDYPL